MVPVYVVNLPRRADRRERAQRRLAGVPGVHFTSDFEEDFDGRTLDLAGVGLFPWPIGSADPWWSRPLRAGEVGCALAHAACWRRAADAGAELAVVLEDDAYWETGDLVATVRDAVERLAAHDPEWGLLYLGRLPREGAVDAPAVPGIVRAGYSYGAYAYVLSARGVAAALGHRLPESVIAVDEFLPALTLPHPREDVRRRFPPRVTAYALEPPFAHPLPSLLVGSDTEDSPVLDAP